jgi:hypothetical protein
MAHSIAEGKRQREEAIAAFTKMLDAVQANNEVTEFYQWARQLPAGEFAAVTGICTIVGQQWLPLLRVAFLTRTDQEAIDKEIDARQAEVAARSRNDER